MLNITIAIAQLRGLLTQQVKAIVSLIQSAGLVRREHTTLTGNPYFAKATPHHNQPASHQASQNKEAVQPISVDQKRGKKTPPASTIAQQKEVGTKLETPASKTRPPAKSAQKANKSRAKRGTPDKSHK